jgi:hypothetical protein
MLCEVVSALLPVPSHLLGGAAAVALRRSLIAINAWPNGQPQPILRDCDEDRFVGAIGNATPDLT